jgi:hypothetical protein
MIKKIAIVGGIVAVTGLGIGGAAWAESNSSAPQAVAASSDQGVAIPAVDALTTSAPVTTPATPGKAGKAAKAGKAGTDGRGKRLALARRLEKVSHAQWVSKDGKTGTFITHDAVRGTVSSVSPTSIVIRATDGTSETFVVNSATKVHVKGDAKTKATGSISQVKVGDAAGVLGTGSGTMTATAVIDRGTVKTAPPTTTAPATS